MLSQWLNVYLWWCVEESNLSLPVISALVFGSLFCSRSEAEEAGVHPPLHPLLSSEVHVTVWWTCCCLVVSLHADKTWSHTVCLAERQKKNSLNSAACMSIWHPPPACAFTAQIACSPSSPSSSSSDPGEWRRMGGDAGGRGDVDAQRETCCFFPRLNQSLSPLLLSAVMSPPVLWQSKTLFLSFTQINWVSKPRRRRLQSASFPSPDQLGEHQLQQQFRLWRWWRRWWGGGNLLLLHWSELYHCWCSATLWCREVSSLVLLSPVLLSAALPCRCSTGCLLLRRERTESEREREMMRERESQRERERERGCAV